MTYSNFTKSLRVEDWPMGGNRRGPCEFHVEGDNPKKTRIVKQTWDENGRPNKPKKDVYGRYTGIATGDDGRTYFLQFSEYTNHISVHDSAFKSDDRAYPAIFEKDPQYETVKASLLALYGL